MKSDYFGSVKPLKLQEIAVISHHVVNVCECECQCELVSVIAWKERDSIVKPYSNIYLLYAWKHIGYRVAGLPGNNQV